VGEKNPPAPDATTRLTRLNMERGRVLSAVPVLVDPRTFRDRDREAFWRTVRSGSPSGNL